MTKIMDSVLDYPLAEGYAIRNIDGSEEDIAAWIEICKNGLLKEEEGRSSYDSRITHWRHQDWIHPERDVFMVYETETGRPVATITGYVQPDGDGDIHMVAALPECRGKKIGHAMLSAALKKLKEDGVPRTHLTTDDWRIPAIKNYFTAGFRPVLYEDSKERWEKLFEVMHVAPIPFLTADGREVGEEDWKAYAEELRAYREKQKAKQEAQAK